MTTADDDTAAISTAEEFAREMDVRAVEREHALRSHEADNRHGQALARIWAWVVAVVIVALLALIAFVVFQMTSSHARVAVEHEKQTGTSITVWCYADPNHDGATSQFLGHRRQDVAGICPDSHSLP